MLTLFFANLLGWIVAHKRLLIYGVGGLVLLILVLFAYRGCKSKPDFKIDEDKIQRINSANRVEREAALESLIEDNLAVTQTVDERNVLAEVNNVEQERAIKEKLEEAAQAADKIRQVDGNITEDELKCLLNKAAC